MEFLEVGSIFFEGLNNTVNSTRIATENRGKFGTKLPRTSAMLAICCYRRIFPEEILVGGRGMFTMTPRRLEVGEVWLSKMGFFFIMFFFFYVKPGEKSLWFAFCCNEQKELYLKLLSCSVFFARISHMIPTCLTIEVEWYGLHHVCMKLNDMDWKLEHLPIFQVVTPDFCWCSP